MAGNRSRHALAANASGRGGGEAATQPHTARDMFAASNNQQWSSSAENDQVDVQHTPPGAGTLDDSSDAGAAGGGGGADTSTPTLSHGMPATGGGGSAKGTPRADLWQQTLQVTINFQF